MTKFGHRNKTAVDRVGSAFLRALVRRMKELGLNQSALARRMDVSRAFVAPITHFKIKKKNMKVL